MLTSPPPVQSSLDRGCVQHEPQRVRACRLLRKMRGGAQSHLIAAEDGHLYVCKCINNPQHRRVLVNEWVSAAVLKYLGIFTAEVAIVDVTAEFAAASPDLYLSAGPKREAIPPGPLFGSRLHVDPEKTAIFDFLPDHTLSRLENRREFLGTLLYDKWAANEDSRQAVFFRAKVRGRTGFWAQMIDHGFVFGGRQWHFQDSPLQGVYFRSRVYQDVLSIESFEPWLHLIQKFPEETVANASKGLPQEWIGGDKDALDRVLEILIRRRQDIRRLVEETIKAHPKAFPNWRG